MRRRNSNKKFFLGLLSGILVMMIAMMLVRVFDIRLFSNKGTAATDIAYRAEVIEHCIDEYYWKDDVPDEKLSEYAAKGMVSALGDKYSMYYTSEEYKEVMDGVDGEYHGIGATVQLEKDTNKKIIIEIQKDAPADRAGLQVGDEIVSINGVDIADRDLNESVDMIRGEEGKTSVLGIHRKKGKKTIKLSITVVCEDIVNKSISFRMLNHAIGYVKIENFDKESVQQFKDAVSTLEKSNQKAMIVDVRNNGGGSLDAVVEMLDYLLPEGTIMTEENKMEGDKVYTSTDEESFGKPMAVLLNGLSASASEVFSGALQDYKMATLVGEKSFGKGIVQTIFSLENTCGGGIKLTTGEYLLPSGRSIHEVGLTPDVEVKYTGDEIYSEEKDNQLKKAIEILKE